MIIRQLFIYSILMIFSQAVQGQDDLPFSSIEETPDSYTAHSVAARMIDGLGFRFRWATEGLRQADLAFRPAEDIRSCRETLDHIYLLVNVIYNTHRNLPVQAVDPSAKDAEEIRTEILMMLQEVRNELLEQQPDMDALSIQFPQQSYPYWNLINGPVADAIYHTGQLIIMRRMSGNPVPPGVNVLEGKTQN